MEKVGPVYRTKLGTAGRLVLPAALRDSPQWLQFSDFEIEEIPGGIKLKPCSALSANEVIASRFDSYLEPLGTGRGLARTKYVSRWTYKGKETIVSENEQPNIWLRKDLVERFDCGSPYTAHYVEPNPEGNPGFNSNVHSTPGLKGKVLAKFRATDPRLAADLVDFLFEQLEKQQ